MKAWKKTQMGFLLFLFLMSACTKLSEQNTLERRGELGNREDSSVKANGSVQMPEPSIISGKSSLAKSGNGEVFVEGGKALTETRFRLTELGAVKEKFLKINDSIVFTGLEKESFAGVQLTVKTHCLFKPKNQVSKGAETGKPMRQENQEEMPKKKVELFEAPLKVLIRQFEVELREAIPLIELLPFEVLLSQQARPTCGFSFKAVNKTGAAHHFELPNLPIVDYRESRFIQLFSKSGFKKREEHSPPYVLIDKISDYEIDTGTEEPMNRLDLICGSFSLSRALRPQQIVPFSFFIFDEETKSQMRNKKSVQNCRIFGYKGKILVGVSSEFRLLNSLSSLFDLTDLSAVEEEKESLTINDTIRLRGLTKEKVYFKDIRLQVKTHCLFSREQGAETGVMEQEETMEVETELREAVPLIELLPAKTLLSRKGPLTCGFFFKAVNKEGEEHQFELPYILIENSESRFIQILEKSGQTIEDDFPYVFINKAPDYWVDTGIFESMDRLDLICDDFSLSLLVRSQQYVPFSFFTFDELERETQDKIRKEKPTQNCRIFGYKNKVLVGVSSEFYLSYPQVPIDIKVKDDLFKGNENSFYSHFMYSDGTQKEKWEDIPLYSYSIVNNHSYSVYLLIEDYEKRELEYGFYGLYYKGALAIRRAFYADHNDTMKLDGIRVVAGKAFHTKVRIRDSQGKKKEDLTFIKMEPKSRIVFSVMLEKPHFSLCEDSREVMLTWLGAVVSLPDLRIYQLVSGKPDLAFLPKNILHLLDTGAGKTFHILTDMLTNDYAQENFVTLWFKREGCSKNRQLDRTYSDIVGLDRRSKGRNKMKVQIIDSKPFDREADYQRSNNIMENIIHEYKREGKNKRPVMRGM